MVESSLNDVDQEYSKSTLNQFIGYWYCKEDKSKYIEYAQHLNSGIFRINLENDEKINFGIEQAINIKKIPDRKPDIEIVYKIIDIAKLDDIFCQDGNNKDILLTAVECPSCSHITIAPKLPSSALIDEKIRKEQVEEINLLIKEEKKKYFEPKRLSMKAIIGIIVIVLYFMIVGFELRIGRN